MDLKTPIKEVNTSFKFMSKRLERLEITTLEDFLYHIPARYENYSLHAKIDSLQPGEIATIKGTIVESKNQYTRGRFTLQKIIIEDESGSIECTWFNQPYIPKTLSVGKLVSIAGRVDHSGKKITMQPKDYEIIESFDSPTYQTGRLVPVYPETKGLSSKWIRNRMVEILKQLNIILSEQIPQSIIKKYNLLSIQNAFEQIHYPENFEMVTRARHRLAFEELFFLQLNAHLRKKEWQKKRGTIPLKVTDFLPHVQKLIDTLPFTLTNAQKKALEEIYTDVAQPIAMNRLLEGDVGSGKTIVAAISMYIAHLNGFQSVLMAPTQILATQHFSTISSILKPFGISTELILGGKQAKNNDLRFKNKDQKSPSILIGTHSLINEDTRLEKLGLVVIDEQQRFGVAQRATLRHKGRNPHVLTMTATPIPRTILLTLYGDLALSHLHELPKGRKPVKTWLVPAEKRMAAYEWIKKKMDEKDSNGNKNQVFLICPFIEESESMATVKSAVKEFKYLQEKIFPDNKLALLHGKMKAGEKEKILKDFHDQKYDMLIATPVVEVGIDIPHATIIVIEAAERFGLSQLHQLRGRVGRNDQESFCLLFTESSAPKTTQRLKYLETTHIGAKLAEIDLKLRGPGEMYGTKQHGLSELKIASFSDFELLEMTKKEAASFIKELDKYPELKEKIEKGLSDTVAPD